jgi:tRNA A-37 threonylcarbamoyl transferase component Bud32/predicted nucleotidyltransferase
LRLDREERQALQTVASSLVKPGSLSAVCGYGSKVAGYARPDSDYDLIVVAKKFGAGVRYKYVKEPIEASALMVDEDLLARDAKTSYLGEFVVGRLLNVYEPVLNGELFRKAELDYKRRIVVEALFELSSDYGDFASHITIPYDYFLFDKLRKRSLVYPPALYSYVKTYTCPLGAENRAASLEGFREATSSLAPKGFLRASDEGVRIFPEKMKGDAFTKVLSLFSLTARGVTQYAVHGYAGRVGLGVVRKEAASKFRRMMERPELPAELERPKRLLTLDEGVFVADATKMTERLAELAGMAKYGVRESDLGEPYSTTRLITISGGGRELSFVVKNFSDVRSLKWALLGVWAVAARRFNMSPLARLEREYQSTIYLRDKGVKVPKIVAVAPDERIIAKEFVPGPPLSTVIDDLLKGKGAGLRTVTAYGELLARVHEAGFALGDAKASNVVVAGAGLYLTDLEQAYSGGDKPWDIAEFLYYTAKLSTKEEKIREIASAFLKGYVSSGERATVARASSSKYLGPFRPFLTLGMTRVLRELMTEYS